MKQVIEQYEAYFKVEMVVPNTQLKKDENELNAPEINQPKNEKKQQRVIKGTRWGNFKRWVGISAPRPEESEESDEETEILATRFITFSEGSVVVLQYLPHKPIRDYGLFAAKPDE